MWPQLALSTLTAPVCCTSGNLSLPSPPKTSWGLGAARLSPHEASADRAERLRKAAAAALGFDGSQQKGMKKLCLLRTGCLQPGRVGSGRSRAAGSARLRSPRGGSERPHSPKIATGSMRSREHCCNAWAGGSKCLTDQGECWMCLTPKGKNSIVARVRTETFSPLTCTKQLFLRTNLLPWLPALRKDQAHIQLA